MKISIAAALLPIVLAGKDVRPIKRGRRSMRSLSKGKGKGNCAKGKKASCSPSAVPSEQPTLSASPSTQPSEQPSLSSSPSTQPSEQPSLSSNPSTQPSEQPSLSSSPSTQPSEQPSLSSNPSTQPSEQPSLSSNPSTVPSEQPSLSSSPSLYPSEVPSNLPSTVCDTICDGGSVSYMYDTTVQTWEAHLIAARNMNCDLASIPDAETATQIQFFLQIETFPADQNFVFIGGYNPTPGDPGTPVVATNYVWSDGADNTFITGGAAPWFTNEPNNADERHIAIATNTNIGGTATPGLTWFDVPTNFQNGAVYKCCDSPVNPYVPLGACTVPEPDIGA